jgi:hypothetical protein
VAQIGETEIEKGCWSADSGFFFQTQHGSPANSRRGDGSATDHTIVGRPNYWDEYIHGELDELEGGPGGVDLLARQLRSHQRQATVDDERGAGCVG